MSHPVIVVAGGGAAGFFAAIHVARNIPGARVMILEKSSQVLGKVRVSGGGRCNTTHACFDNRQLIRFYPRGGKALLGPFSRFSTTDTIEWFHSEGVELKTESDGRMFPESDSSQTIIDCLMNAVEHAGVEIRYSCGVQSMTWESDAWQVELSSGEYLKADAVILATGSSNKTWEMLSGLGIEIVPPVPSLFTLHVAEKPLHDLSGLSVANVSIKLEGTKIQTEGPLLITHWGFSGPATLKLSAWAARELYDAAYQGAVLINFLPSQHQKEVQEMLMDARGRYSRKQPRNTFLYAELPRRLWEFLLLRSKISDNLNWADLSNKQLNALATELTSGRFVVNGKSTFKEEFVTCGGVSIDTIDLKTMRSKQYSGLYFCGEVVNVDAVTGGFNFQWAWTSGYLAAAGLTEDFRK